MTCQQSVQRLSRGERFALFLLVAFLVGFGVFVEIRVAMTQKRRVDLDVCLRAAWAVRNGENPYRVTNEQGWHYNYPPLLAILLVPLAEPPPEADRSGTVPFLAALAIWNAFSLFCLAVGVHCLGRALEQTLPDPVVSTQPCGCRGWWALRALPVWACLPMIGVTLSRAQVNLLLLVLLCATAAAAVRGRRFQAGLWLAGAICLKIIPAYLLVYPLLKRDWRWLAGCAWG